MVPDTVLPEVRLGAVTVKVAAEKFTLQLKALVEVFLQVVVPNSAGTETASSVAAPVVDWNTVPLPEFEPDGMVTTFPPGDSVTLTPPV
jgi:hypothetical protein